MLAKACFEGGTLLRLTAGPAVRISLLLLLLLSIARAASRGNKPIG
jgi:hypothetical protein